MIHVLSSIPFFPSVFQDAHELFHVLTETLDEETSRYPSVLSLFDVKHLEVFLSGRFLFIVVYQFLIMSNLKCHGINIYVICLLTLK